MAKGLSKARAVMESIGDKTRKATLIEITHRHGVRIGGGGQPYGDNKIKLERKDGLYLTDKHPPIRKHHENPEVKALYENYLDAPLGEKSHHLSHTHYGVGKNHWAKTGHRLS